jgi:plastocyanin
MRYLGFTTLAASALVLGACGGGDQKAADNSAATSSTPAPANSAATAAPAATPAATSSVPAAPITGKIQTVKMYGDAQGYRFDPASITIKQGDGIKFVVASGGPHNVAFDPAAVPAAAKAQLAANMPTPMSELSSPMLMNPNDNYIVSFAKVPPGTYEVHCTPHLAMNMNATITVTP